MQRQTTRPKMPRALPYYRPPVRRKPCDTLQTAVCEFSGTGPNGPIRKKVEAAQFPTSRTVFLRHKRLRNQNQQRDLPFANFRPANVTNCKNSVWIVRPTVDRGGKLGQKCPPSFWRKRTAAHGASAACPAKAQTKGNPRRRLPALLAKAGGVMATQGQAATRCRVFGARGYLSNGQPHRLGRSADKPTDAVNQDGANSCPGSAASARGSPGQAPARPGAMPRSALLRVRGRPRVRRRRPSAPGVHSGNGRWPKDNAD